MGITKNEILTFSNEIEALVSKKDLSYLEAILHYCENSGIELEMIPKLLSPPLKAKLTEQAESLFLLKKRKRKAKLPI